MTNPQADTHWWKTLPGVLSGLAAVLTAIGGLLLALHQVGYLGGGNADTTPQPSINDERTIEGVVSAIELPTYVVLDSAYGEKKAAQQRLVELGHLGYSNSGFFWIPDFDFLSGAELFQVYVGPFADKADALVAICQYNKKLDTTTYGVRLTLKPGREEFRCGDGL